MRKFTLIFLIIAATAIQCFAVEIDINKTTELALKNSREIKMAAEDVNGAYGRLFEGFSGLLPKINLGITYTKLSEPQIDISGPASAAFAASMSPTLVSDSIVGSQLTVQQTIFSWGRLHNVNKQTKLYYRIAKEKYLQVSSEVLFKAKEAYYKALLSEKTMSIATESLKLSKSRYESTEKLFKEGKASSYDVSRTRVGYANSQVALLRAENAEKLAKEYLATTLNAGDDISVVGEFSYDGCDFNLDELLKKAIDNRHEQKQAIYREEISKSLLSISSSENKPTLAASYSYNIQAADPSAEWSEWDKRWQAMLVLQWPLFDGLASYGRVKSARAVRAQISLTNKSLEEGIKLEVRSAFLNYVQVGKSIEAQSENTSSAKENLQIAEKRYALGLMSFLELQDVHFAFTQSEMNYQQSLYDYNMAVAMIKKVIGE